MNIAELKEFVEEEKELAEDKRPNATDNAEWNYWDGRKRAFNGVLNKLNDLEGRCPNCNAYPSDIKQGHSYKEIDNGIAYDVEHLGDLGWLQRNGISLKFDRLNNQLRIESIEQDTGANASLNDMKNIGEDDEDEWPKEWSDIDIEGPYVTFANTMRVADGTMYVKESIGSEGDGSNLWMPFDVYLENNV